MFEIKVDTSKARATVALLRRLPKEIRKGVSDALRDEAKIVAKDAKALLRGGKKQGGTLAAGEPPRSRTGRLLRSIRQRRGRGGLSYLVESRDDPKKGPVALWLEMGTEHGGRGVTHRSTRLVTRGGVAQVVRSRRSARVGGRQRMPSHPFLTLALERRAKQVEQAVGAAITKALREAKQ